MKSTKYLVFHNRISFTTIFNTCLEAPLEETISEIELGESQPFSISFEFHSLVIKYGFTIFK